MFKAFFLLWLVVFAPIFFLIMPHYFNPLPVINSYATKSFFVKTFSGTFYLLEKNLQATPSAQWPEKIKQLSANFGYPLRLMPLHFATENPALQAQLNANEFAFSNGEPELLFKRVLNSQWVISMALDESTTETISRGSRGPVYLMLQEFNHTPQEQWPEILDHLAEYFYFDLKILPMENLTFAPDKMQDLADGQLIWLTQADGQLIFFQQLPDQKSVLSAGALLAIDSNIEWIYLTFGIIFILLVSIGMFLWVYPLWRDLKRLTVTATSFGDGFLQQRAELAKNSVIARLGQSFNIMANRIEKLILGHKELTNAIAHDLRTPLYRLRFAFDMLDGDDVTVEQRQKYRHSINTSIDDLDHLISQTLVLSRYSRTMDISHFSECKLAEKISNEIELFRLEHTQLSINFETCTELSERLLWVDSRALLRALNNLLSNASRYAETSIKISLNRARKDCVLTVEDDGPGINQQQWEKIFQPFAQLENIQRGNLGGHGLGLAIVQQIALWHKGHVNVTHSTLGGAKFEIRWPEKLKP
jgi:two-component system sensor histidine kinase RstB